jgi:WD40 repeat protein
MNLPPDHAAPSPSQPLPTSPGLSKTPVWSASPSNGKYFINSIAVSADGGRVVGGTFYHVYAPGETRLPPPVAISAPLTTPPDPETGTFGTYCYNATGTPLWSDTYDGWQGVYWVTISADGARAASGGLYSQTPQAGLVRAFDATNGTKLLDYPTQQRVNQVALSHDGEWLVSAAESVVLFRFDGTTGGYIKTGEFTPTGGSIAYPNGVVSVGLSADGSTIVFADYAGHLGVLSNEGGLLGLQTQWNLPASFCHMVALSPDGQWFAAGGAAGCFYLCETSQFVASGSPTFSYDTGVAGAVYGVAVEQDGSGFVGVVNVGDGGTVYFVQRVGDSVMLECKFDTLRNPNSAALNTAHRLLAVADGHPDGTPGNFYLYANVGRALLPPPARATLVWQFQAGNMSWPITISAAGNAIVAGSDDTNIYYFTPGA